MTKLKLANSLPAAAAVDTWDRQTDGQTDTVQLHRACCRVCEQHRLGELTALTAGGSSEAEMATPTSDPVLPPSIDRATPAPDGRAINTPTHRLRPRPLSHRCTAALLYTIDTIRGAILTCTQKLTWVRLIYRTEPTIKKWKKNKKKIKSKKQICSEVSVNPRSQSGRRKRRLRWKGFAEKEGLSLEWNSEGVMEY